MKNNKESLLQRVYDIAQKNSKVTRADLAYELKSYGIENDSILVSFIVSEAYSFFKRDARILNNFVTNDYAKTLIDQASVYQLLKENKTPKALEVVQENSIAIDHNLRMLQDVLVISGNHNTASKTSLLYLTGAGGTVNIQNQAQELFKGYSEMINLYKGSKTSIKYLIEDFVTLRENIGQVYYDYSLSLIDIFGDSIKVVSPEIFDFDRVEFLDYESMLSKVELEFQRISSSCSTIIGEITTGFKGALTDSVKYYRYSKSKEIGLVMAAANMLNHYMESDQKTLKLKSELQILKNKVKLDVTTVKGDLSRLSVIHSTLNQLYIPKAIAFNNHSESILKEELRLLLNSVYNTPELMKLKGTRDALLRERHLLEIKIKDQQSNITYYIESIKNTEQLLEDLKSSFHSAINRKPSKPNVLLNMANFGMSNKKYERELYEWDTDCKPVIESYKDLQVTLKMDRTEFENYVQDLEKDNKELKKVRIDIQKINNVIKSQIVVDEVTKVKVVDHLEELIKLLRLGKEIMSSKFNDKILSTTSIKDYEGTKLPDHLMENLTTFSNSIKKSLISNNEISKATLDYISYQESSNTELKNPNYSDVEVVKMTEITNNIVNVGVGLFEVWVNLKKEENKGEEQNAYYNSQLVPLQEDFRSQLLSINNKSEILNDIIFKINSSSSVNEMKEGVLMLSDVGEINVSREDIEEMLKGNENIEI